MTEGPAVQSGHLSITGLPLELIRLILDRVYEDPSTLVVTKSLRSPLQTVTGLPINILLVNHFIRSEALSAIRRSRQNTIDLKLYATLPDVTAQLTSPSAFSFLSSVTTLSLTDFRYESSTLKLWKTICPKLGNVRISHAYSPTASASVHRCMIVRNFPSLLHGDADELFATTAVERILAVHPTFCLSDLRGLNLTFSNVIDFWSHEWGPEWYHENRVLVLDLTISENGCGVSHMWFRNRIRNVPYRESSTSKVLPGFKGVEYEVKYMSEGNRQHPDYDWRKDCFRSPYSTGLSGV